MVRLMGRLFKKSLREHSGSFKYPHPESGRVETRDRSRGVASHDRQGFRVIKDCGELENWKRRASLTELAGGGGLMATRRRTRDDLIPLDKEDLNTLQEL